MPAASPASLSSSPRRGAAAASSPSSSASSAPLPRPLGDDALAAASPSSGSDSASSWDASDAAAHRKRLESLFADASPFLPAACAGDAALRERVLGLLSGTLRTYHRVFRSAASAEAWCAGAGVAGAERDVVLCMQRSKLFPERPTLELALRAVFLALCVFVVVDLARTAFLVPFLVILALTDSVLARVKWAFGVAGRCLSDALRRCRRLRGGEDKAARGPLDSRLNMLKWKEQSWQLFVHAGFAVIGGRILSGVRWYEDAATCWQPSPHVQAQALSLDVRLLYLAQLAVWIYTCIIHTFVDAKRKDYFVMFAHHIVTIVLIAFSYSYDYFRIGIVVMYIHDVSDIFIDVLKLLNYLKLEGAGSFFVVEASWGVTLISWAFWRLYNFPRHILGSILASWEHPDVPKDVQTAFYVLLVTLLSMHVYWFVLLVKVGFKIKNSSSVQARRIYEGDSDDDEEEDAAAGGGGEGGSRDAAPSALAADADGGLEVIEAVGGEGLVGEEGPAAAAAAAAATETKALRRKHAKR